MSYCRWSSDCHQSDVYVYADVQGGWTTHVAGRRRVPVKPVPAPPDNTYPDAVIEYWMECSRWVDDWTAWEWAPVPAHAGESFNDDTPGGCADRLEQLRAAGVNVPQYAIDRLREEAKEAQP
jgi:hypothetical protein